MKKFLLLLILPLALLSCTKDDEPEKNAPKLYLSFDPVVGGQEVQIGERFTNPHGYSVEVLELKFYISNIQLISATDSVQLSEIEFINIRENKRTVEFEVPLGNYTGIRFDLGVPADLNGTQNPDFSTSIFDANHPLSESNGMYWSWDPGYRFFSFEGNNALNVSAEEFLPENFAFHTGRDTLYRQVPDFEKTITLDYNAMQHLHFGIELNRYFENGSEEIDLENEQSFHGSYDQMDLGIKLANNSAATFELLN